jgi:hypothetical protein
MVHSICLPKIDFLLMRGGSAGSTYAVYFSMNLLSQQLYIPVETVTGHDRLDNGVCSIMGYGPLVGRSWLEILGDDKQGPGEPQQQQQFGGKHHQHKFLKYMVFTM